MGRSSPGRGGGYRIAVKMETSIKLICQPFGHCVFPLDEPGCSQQERDLETCWKINTKPAANKQTKRVSTLFSKVSKAEREKNPNNNKGRVLKIHRSLVFLKLANVGAFDSTSVWVAFLRKPLTVRVGQRPDQSLLF